MSLAFTLSCMGKSDDVTAATCVTAQREVLRTCKSSKVLTLQQRGSFCFRIQRYILY